VTRYIYQGIKRDVALNIAGITKHQYYYRSSGKKRGRPPSSITKKIENDEVTDISNEEVVADIKKIQEDPDTDYGYRKMTYALMVLGYFINHKKIYRLMKDHLLLKEKYQKHSREFVKYRRVMPEKPLQLLEMDIKFVWAEEYRRHVFVLTVIDTFTRVVLGWKSAYNMKQDVIKQLWKEVIANHLQPYDCLNKHMEIEIRNDNDSRFIAKSVQRFFKENKIKQVFTHPYTPQENGHIESFHAILSQKLSRYTFWSLTDLDQCLILFYEKYNNQRLHSSTLHLPPMVFWHCWEKDLVGIIKNDNQRKIKFKLLIPYYKLSGNMNQRAVPCPQPKPLDGVEAENKEEMSGAETSHQPSV